MPWEASADLDTIGVDDFGGKLTGSMTAHPKEDPQTGEVHFFGYSPFAPFLTYYVADASGAIVRSEVVDGSGPSLMHDFAITREHVVFINSPVVFDDAEHSGIPRHRIPVDQRGPYRSDTRHGRMWRSHDPGHRADRRHHVSRGRLSVRPHPRVSTCATGTRPHGRP
ncbi:carotenoid oxygenase family protein [Streptomyces bambusae]|uniref:Dioxygenase n=1 Tax=Streptomyces bambusae TaxID=1550616 RepID=A0ABS6Z4Z1_9ACTN|nr:carotenoid oxygenase family protein [Streptomyces bambusae]MBW5482792.1 hypothetical protein [Streptomyces bambusae]